MLDLLIIGAGPAGIHAACTAQDLGLSYRIIDRRGLAHSFVEYPQAMRFFSPPDEMEVGGVPFPMRGGEKPAREDILPYFRGVAAHRKLELSLWERIVGISGRAGAFSILTASELNSRDAREYHVKSIVLACGVWDVPNRLECEGAMLPHVRYRFHEPTEYFGCPVLVVGGGNSAVYAALTLAEAHARVTMGMRREPVPYQSHLRPFVVRDLQLALEAGHLVLHTGVRIARTEPGTTWLEPIAYDAQAEKCGTLAGEAFPVEAQFVFAMIGQRADAGLFEMLGLELDSEGRPLRNSETYETERSGVYVVGSLAGQKIDIIITARAQTAEVVKRIAAGLNSAPNCSTTPG